MIHQSTSSHLPSGALAAVVPPQPLNDHYDALLRRVSTLRNGSAGAAEAIGVTSSTSGEGVSTVALNLAISAARLAGGRVLLIDANLTAPSIARSLGVDSQPGLYETLCNGLRAAECIADTAIENLSVLPAGAVDCETPSVFRLSKVAELLAELKRTFSFIVLDLPTADRLSTCFEVAPALDGLLLVVEADGVGCEQVQRVRRQLDDAQANILGVVLNKQR